MSLDAPFAALRAAISRLEPRPGEPDTVPAALAELDGAIAELARCRQTDGRLAEVSEALFKLSSLDFSCRTELRGDGSVLDAVVGCINMLAEELEAHLDERTSIEHELEDRVRLRTAELETSMERYRALIEGTQAVPWEADARSLALTYISPGILGLLGEPDTAFLGGVAIWERVHLDDRTAVLEKLAALVNGAIDHVDIEYRFVCKHGAVIDVRSAVASQRDGQHGRPRLRGIMFDVTSQKRLERELRQAQKLESVGRLAGGIAHEINTPLQFVSDSVQFVRDAMTDLGGMIETCRAMCRPTGAEPEQRPGTEIMLAAEEPPDLDYLLDNVPVALDHSLQGLQRIAVIVRSMQDFAHPDERAMTAVDLHRGLKSILVIAHSEYKCVADVETDFADLPPVICHGGDVNQATLSIIVNAAEAIGSHLKGAEKGRIAIRTRRDGEYAVIAISDTGGGVPEEIRDRIFDPFFTTKEVGKGTGQGLAVARSIVEERHGGTLTFETRAGVGTTFFIRLPIDGTRRGPGPTQRAGERPAKGHGPNRLHPI